MTMRVAFLALFAAASLFVADAGTIHEKIVDEKRFVVFNSRQLTGECCKSFAVVCDRMFGSNVVHPFSPRDVPNTQCPFVSKTRRRQASLPQKLLFPLLLRVRLLHPLKMWYKMLLLLAVPM